MLRDEKLQAFLDIVSQRIDLDSPTVAAYSDLGASSLFQVDERAMQAGIATIGVSGTLVNRYATAPSGTLSYDELKNDLSMALENPKVKAILMRFDSGGGEVDGVWSAVDKVRAVAQQKPVWAIADGCAASAAYALFSQASRRVMTRTAIVGSVGVKAKVQFNPPPRAGDTDYLIVNSGADANGEPEVSAHFTQIPLLSGGN